MPAVVFLVMLTVEESEFMEYKNTIGMWSYFSLYVGVIKLTGFIMKIV